MLLQKGVTGGNAIIGNTDGADYVTLLSKYKVMLIEYIESALEKANYEIIEDALPFYGEVPILKGVWAQGKTLEECRKNLKDVIEGWIIIRLEKHLAIPTIGKFKIEQTLGQHKKIAYA